MQERRSEVRRTEDRRKRQVGTKRDWAGYDERSGDRRKKYRREANGA
ncbi:MAG: hypothetical protein P9L92_06275 [Candidatus Electryonea clarkiae]|nr:hypothetical protein [Candidatus Electryonea clarkiae]MDP8287716.1 hypothetical protein [Candidatus Electryonea clarkiae]